MANIISYDVNNGGKLMLVQRTHDESVLIRRIDEKGKSESIPDQEAWITPGDMVMLINYYRFIKRENIHHDFINPDGTVPEPK